MTTQTPLLKDTLIMDEGLIGSCDVDHLKALRTQLLPNLPVRLFLITHQDDLQTALSHTLRVPESTQVTHGSLWPEPLPKNDAVKLPKRPFLPEASGRSAPCAAQAPCMSPSASSSISPSVSSSKL
jgi:hypothetical protein